MDQGFRWSPIADRTGDETLGDTMWHNNPRLEERNSIQAIEGAKLPQYESTGPVGYGDVGKLTNTEYPARPFVPQPPSGEEFKARIMARAHWPESRNVHDVRRETAAWTQSTWENEADRRRDQRYRNPTTHPED